MISFKPFVFVKSGVGAFGTVNPAVFYIIIVSGIVYADGFVG
jgi:hypothetical protein